MERLFLFTARKYADSGGRCDEAFGAFSDRGAAGGLHDPIERISYTEKNMMRFYPTSIVTVLYFLDLYNVRAKVREEHCRGWTRKNAGQVENSNSPQRWFNTFYIIWKRCW
jgi:hypothetical protein